MRTPILNGLLQTDLDANKKQLVNLATSIGGGVAQFALDFASGTPVDITLTNNATVSVFGGTNNFAGCFIVTSLVTGSCGLFITGGGALSLVGSSSGGFSTTAANAGTLNAYLSSLVVVIENKTGATITVRVCAIRVRASN